eukprot:5499130-Amphidinium_carterae.2
MLEPASSMLMKMSSSTPAKGTTVMFLIAVCILLSMNGSLKYPGIRTEVTGLNGQPCKSSA